MLPYFAIAIFFILVIAYVLTKLKELYYINEMAELKNKDIISFEYNGTLRYSDFVFWNNPESLRYILTQKELESEININLYFKYDNKTYIEIEYYDSGIDIDEVLDKILALE